MEKDQRRYEALTKFQSHTAMWKMDESVYIREQFQRNCCLDATNYILNNIDSTKYQPSRLTHRTIRQSIDNAESLIPNECVNELDGIRHFERIFQDRFSDLHRWPTWFKGSLEAVINQARGPFAIFLNHDQSIYSTTFPRQILCSSSILNVFQKYKCILWPWDVTHSLKKQQLLEKSGRARKILVECLSYFRDVNNYPLLLLLSRQNNNILLLDVINGNWNLDQTRACLERTLNPILEQSIIPINDTISLSPGWVGGRTVGSIRRRPPFLTAFRSSRPIRSAQRPSHISFYQRDKEVKEIIVSIDEARKWLNQKRHKQYVPHKTDTSIQAKFTIANSSESPAPLLSVFTKHECPTVKTSLRRASWTSLINR